MERGGANIPASSAEIWIVWIPGISKGMAETLLLNIFLTFFAS